MAEQRWAWTDDPGAPCSYCVQWQSVDDDLMGDYVPIHPDGSIVPLVRARTHPACDEMVARYVEETAAEWRWRNGKTCPCGHDGRDHDHDEVGECQRCGCAGAQIKAGA